MTKAIILMAGHSSRFAAEGFDKPKTLLPMPDGRSLLEWQIDAIGLEHYLLIGQKDHHNAHRGVLKRIYFKYAGLKDTWLRKPTRGPMATLFARRQHFMRDREDYVVAYCDNLPTRIWTLAFLDAVERKAPQAAIAAIRSDEERLTLLPHEMSLRAGGIFWFESGKLLAQMIRKHPREENNGVPDAVYRTQKWCSIEAPGLADLGVPREYKNWMAEQGKPVHGW